MNIILLVTFYTLFTVVAWRRLPLAVLFVIATLPSYLIRFHLGPIPMTLLEGMILITFIIWCTQRMNRNDAAASFLPISVLLPVTIFLLTATISMFLAPDLRAAAGIWKAYFVEPILFFIVLHDTLKKSALSATQIITALSITALLLSLYAIYQRLTGFGIPPPWDQELRATSIFPYPNALGLFLAPLVPLFVARLLTQLRHSERSEESRAYARRLLVIGYWLLVTLISILAIIFAQSTGALVGVAAGLIMLAGFYSVQAWRTWHPRSGIRNLSTARQDQESGLKKILIHNSLFIIPLASIVALAIAWFSFPQLHDELLLQDWSGHVRRTQWSETIDMLKDRPILGAGLAGYKETLAPYHKATYLEIFEYPHNIILNFWSETGLLGLATFIGLMMVFFKKTWHQLKFPIPNSQFPIKSQTSNSQTLSIGHWGLVIGAVGAMITLLVHGLVDVPYFKNDLAILFWIIYALGLLV